MQKKRSTLQSREVVILITASSKREAQKIARTLVGERLAACVNLVSPVQSIYRWESKICDDREVLMFCKSRGALFGRIVRRVKALHSYSVPEVIALPIVKGSASYLRWIDQVTRPSL